MFKNPHKPIFVLEMANNHMGDPAHAARIIREFRVVTEPFADVFAFAFKLQMRDPSIIHPDFRNRMDRIKLSYLRQQHFS